MEDSGEVRQGRVENIKNFHAIFDIPIDRALDKSIGVANDVNREYRANVILYAATIIIVIMKVLVAFTLDKTLESPTIRTA